MTMLARLRARTGAAKLKRLATRYDTVPSDEVREREQLELLNREWRRIIGTSPYYGKLRDSLQFPDKFESLAQFAESVPETTKSIVQSSKDEIRCNSRPPDLILSTGGSTASPIQIPAWKSERRAIRGDLWLGRRWYGIGPESRLFLIWGHSHLLGTGLKAWMRGRLRSGMDRLLGYHRFSAYDLQPKAMMAAGSVLLRFGPDYLLGYSVALDQFVRANSSRAERFRALGLKAVIGTAEAFPSQESVSLLEHMFDCPVAMEYGAAEVGVMGHTHPGGGYRTFWRTHFLEAIHVAEDRYRLIVTSLHPRCFPLVRYDTGDEIQIAGATVQHRTGLTSFERVVGRCNDYVLLADGTRVHSEVFTHAVREYAAIRNYQVVQKKEDEISLHYLSDASLCDADREGILTRLAQVHPHLHSVKICKVSELEKTMAGKTRMVVTM